ncbi:MAG: flagellar biosynthetic protein FliQ [Tepidisphaeraceae bacterium]
MTLEAATDFLRHSLILALLIASPMLIIGLIVGIVISIVQAVTQIQEQTLVFVPKITAMIIAAVVIMPWIGVRLMEYSAAVFGTGQLP